MYVVCAMCLQMNCVIIDPVEEQRQPNRIRIRMRTATKIETFFFVLLTAVSESFRLMCGTKIGIHMLRSALAAAKQNLIRMF